MRDEVIHWPVGRSLDSVPYLCRGSSPPRGIPPVRHDEPGPSTDEGGNLPSRLDGTSFLVTSPVLTPHLSGRVTLLVSQTSARLDQSQGKGGERLGAGLVKYENLELVKSISSSAHDWWSILTTLRPLPTPVHTCWRRYGRIPSTSTP